MESKHFFMNGFGFKLLLLDRIYGIYGIFLIFIFRKKMKNIIRLAAEKLNRLVMVSYIFA